MSLSFQKIDLAGPIAAFPTNPQFDAKFKGAASVVLYTQTGGTEVEFSFDGTNVDGRLLAGSVVTASTETNNYQKIWFRTVTAATVSVGAAVESTGGR